MTEEELQLFSNLIIAVHAWQDNQTGDAEQRARMDGIVIRRATIALPAMKRAYEVLRERSALVTENARLQTALAEMAMRLTDASPTNGQPED